MFHVALNATAYDDLPSGARNRAVGLAAGLLQAGARVTVYAARGQDFASLVEAAHGAPADPAALRVVPTPLDGKRPVRRALSAGRWFERHVDASVDLFLTDYYPALRSVPTAVTVHDLRYLAAAGDEPLARVAWFRTVFPRVVRQATYLVVPSHAVASECRELAGAVSDRVVVVPNALGRAWRDAPPSAAPGEHFVAVGTAEPRKALPFLVRAYADARAENELPPLVLVGRGGRELDRALALAGDLGVARDVVYRGPVDDSTLVGLVRRSCALLFPSRYEGFGLPVLEALSVGVPVLAADTPAVAEAASGGAMLLPRDDLPAWSRGIVAASRDPSRVDDVHVAAARRVTWQSAAESLLAGVSRR